MDIRHKLFILIAVFAFFISITMGFPSLYINDELISANQLNHLLNGGDLFHGFDRFTQPFYAASHQNILCYTLALPVFAYPAYHLLNLFQDSFGLFIILLWFLLLVMLAICTEWWFPRYARWKGIPWTYGLIGSAIVLLILNLLLYKPEPFSDFGEIAALVFTSHIFFALYCGLVFLIVSRIFKSDWWGVFGVAAVICCSSALFWSGNAKDHIATFFFVALAAYFFVLFILEGSHLHLVSSFLSVGLLAWVRPELGFGVCIGMVISTVLVSLSKGLRQTLLSLVCSGAVLFGALPLFINNYAATGNPLLPLMVRNAPSFVGVATSRFTVKSQSMGGVLQDIFGVFFNPVYSKSAAIFQVSPLSFFAVISLIMVVYCIIRKRECGISGNDYRIILFLATLAASIFLVYLRSMYILVDDQGITPDMRYIATIYLPLIILGLYSFKVAGFPVRDIKIMLETLVLLTLTSLPVMFAVLQVFWVVSMADQLLMQMVITYLFLTAAVLIFVLFVAKKVKGIWFAYSLSTVMVSSLLWELIVDFRFVGMMYGGYNFWLPMMRWIRHIVIVIFT